MDGKLYDDHIKFWYKWENVSLKEINERNYLRKKILFWDSLKNIALHSSAKERCMISKSTHDSPVRSPRIFRPFSILSIYATGHVDVFLFYYRFLPLSNQSKSPSAVFHLVEVSRSCVAFGRTPQWPPPYPVLTEGRATGCMLRSSLGRDEEHDDEGLTVSPAVRGRAREEELGMVGGEKKWKVSGERMVGRGKEKI